MSLTTAQSNIKPQRIYWCPWCGALVTMTVSEADQNSTWKYHYQQHLYQDLIEHEVSSKAASVQRQAQLKNYLATILNIDKPQ